MSASSTVRFAPSPTGLFHIGSARTTLFNYLFAKKYGAKFVLRFEDTDVARSKKEFEEDILEGISWLGLAYDETHRQSERKEVYEQHIENLLDKGSAYVSKEEGGGRREVIRFKNPGGEITFADEVRGEVTFDVAELGDFVVAKSKTEPLYHLAVVIDDLEMGVTHVIRGEDHISNTPRQILILEALGGERPVYAHLPMILAPDRSKMSKRHGAVSVTEYRDQGFLPEAIVNYLALLGWNPGTDKEIFSLEEIIEEFDLSRIQKSGAIFSLEKLRWFNEEHSKRLSFEERLEALAKYLEGHSDSEERAIDLARTLLENGALAETVLERISVYGDALTLLKEGEFDFVFVKPTVEAGNLVWKNSSSEAAHRHLLYVKDKFSEALEDSFTADAVKEMVWDYATEEGRGDVLWPLRFALSGKERSADPFTLSEILGKKEVIERLDAALLALES